MNVPWQAALTAQAIVMTAMVALWLWSLRLRNASIVDPFWGPAFVLTAWVAAGMHRPLSWRAALMLGLVTVWGLRLAGYLLRRNVGHGEDRRYAEMRRHHGDRFPLVSLGTVFLLQGFLVGLIAWPVVCGVADPGTAPWGIADGAGLLLWATGFAFETIGDGQLARFQRDPRSRGRVLDRGLWRYTRHPNYFGEFCMGWGYWLLAVAAGGAWTIFSPVVMSFLLLRVSGVSLLEQTIGDRRPEYAAYQRRTSAFWPWPPRRSSKT